MTPEHADAVIAMMALMHPEWTIRLKSTDDYTITVTRWAFNVRYTTTHRIEGGPIHIVARNLCRQV